MEDILEVMRRHEAGSIPALSTSNKNNKMPAQHKRNGTQARNERRRRALPRVAEAYDRALQLDQPNQGNAEKVKRIGADLHNLKMKIK